ncbi:CvpA family protein [Caulobacter sp. NIBR2454]|uniref:CvpA family protein n=1 Tax=Caulobacter sp. NIBR2454 TaxID=3015996 RepID=UPI0022B74467|nr:CvpA family protein [Caulobacter sp. NIBR2454]
MTAFDVIAILILLVSGAIGFARGAMRELVTMGALLVAGAVAIFGLRLTGPVFRSFIDPAWAGTTAAVLVVFVLLYILLRLIGANLTQRIHAAQSLGMLDRSIGVGFGLIRALVVLGAFNLVFHAATPEERTPRWVTNSVMWPLSEVSGAVLKSLAPKGGKMAGQLAPAIEKAVRDGASDEGYDADQRRSVDDLVEKSR